MVQPKLQHGIWISAICPIFDDEIQTILDHIGPISRYKSIHRKWLTIHCSLTY